MCRATRKQRADLHMKCRYAGCEEKSRTLTEYEIARMKNWLDVAVRAIIAMQEILGKEDEVYP